jgi:hypothetical protein
MKDISEYEQLQKQIEKLTHECNSYKLLYKIAQDVLKNLNAEITMLNKDCTSTVYYNSGTDEILIKPFREKDFYLRLDRRHLKQKIAEFEKLYTEQYGKEPKE